MRWHATIYRIEIAIREKKNVSDPGASYKLKEQILSNSYHFGHYVPVMWSVLTVTAVLHFHLRILAMYEANTKK